MNDCARGNESFPSCTVITTIILALEKNCEWSQGHLHMYPKIKIERLQANFIQACNWGNWYQKLSTKFLLH